VASIPDDSSGETEESPLRLSIAAAAAAELF
jgi:hypothetical protein